MKIRRILMQCCRIIKICQKFQIITDVKSIEKYGGNKMYFAPPIAYDEVMKKFICKVITVGKIREFLQKRMMQILQNL